MKQIRKKTSLIWKIDSADLIKVVATANSLKEILHHLGLDHISGGNYKTLKARLQADKINYSHIKYVPKGLSKKSLEEILIENSTYCRNGLKKRLLEEGLLEYKCSNCGSGPKWKNKVLVLVLDHKNGKNNDNRLINLRFLCPNCNSQTATFAGRNQKKRLPKKCFCGKVIHKTSKQCLDCSYCNQRKVNRPSKDELARLLWEKPTTQIAATFSVSDKAVEKWSKIYGLDKPPRGYWANKINMHH